jgi:Ca2+-binding EF-hand superfamily protein
MDLMQKIRLFSRWSLTLIKNKSDSIDVKELLDMMTAKMSDKDTREDIYKIFRLLYNNNSGNITPWNLRKVAKVLRETMNDEVLWVMAVRAY